MFTSTTLNTSWNAHNTRSFKVSQSLTQGQNPVPFHNESLQIRRGWKLSWKNGVVTFGPILDILHTVNDQTDRVSTGKARRILKNLSRNAAQNQKQIPGTFTVMTARGLGAVCNIASAFITLVTWPLWMVVRILFALIAQPLGWISMGVAKMWAWKTLRATKQTQKPEPPSGFHTQNASERLFFKTHRFLFSDRWLMWTLSERLKEMRAPFQLDVQNLNTHTRLTMTWTADEVRSFPLFVLDCLQTKDKTADIFLHTNPELEDPSHENPIRIGLTLISKAALLCARENRNTPSEWGETDSLETLVDTAHEQALNTRVMQA